jgi:hypothetical protein
VAFGDADASTPAFVKANAVSKAATTASFTPPSGAWLVAFAVHDTAGGNLTNTSLVTDSQGLSWSRPVVHSKQDDGSGANNGHIAVSIAKVTSSVAMTVTTTGTNTNNPAGLYVRVITSADPVTLMDATPTEGHNTNAVISLAITVATNGARVFLIACDWNLAANMTAGTGQTAIVSDGIGSPDLRFYVGVQNAVSAPGAVTMSTASPSSGNTNNYAVIALRPASGSQSAAANTATESDTAVALGRLKTRAVGSAAETDAAIAVARVKRRAVGTTAETGTAVTVGRAKTKTVGTAASTEIGQPLGRSKTRLLGTAVESDAAFPVASGGIVRAVGTCAETDAAPAIARSKARTTGTATTSEVAVTFARAKRKAIGTALETDLAASVTFGSENVRATSASTVSARRTSTFSVTAGRTSTSAVTARATSSGGVT